MALTIPVSEIVEKSKNPLLGKHESWGRVPLGGVATILNGFAFKSSEFSNDRGMPLIRIRDVGKDRSETNYLGEYDSRYIVEPGDLLVGMDGDFNCARWRGPRGLLNQRVCKITLKSNIYVPKFLDYTLPGYLKAINDVTSSVTVKHLSSKSIEEIPLPLPPKEVQQSIVAEIEKQFSRLDEAVASLKRTKANLKRYKAAVLKSAVEGKLTKDWRKQHPNVEPASKFLERILAERRAKWNGKGKYKEPAAPDTSGLSELPKGWVWASAEQITEFITKGTTPTATKLSEGVGEVQFLKVYNLTFDGSLNHTYKPAFVTRKTHQVELARSKVLAGDVLINIVGPPLGQVSVVPPTLAEANINQAIARFRPIVPLSSEFLSLMLRTEDIMWWAIRRAKTTAGQSNLTLELCRALPIPLPPLSEQTPIVAEVERRLSVIDELEATAVANLTRAERLRQSILQQAFSGALPLAGELQLNERTVYESRR